MLILSRARIAVDAQCNVRVEGLWKRYAGRIEAFVAETGLRGLTVRLRNGRYVFSNNVDAATQQRIRNFLVNRCPLKNLDL